MGATSAASAVVPRTRGRPGPLVHPERGEVAQVQLPAAGPGEELRAEQDEEQAEVRPGVRERDVRLRVVDEEDVAGLRGQAAPPEHEGAAALLHQRDLEVVVPVHRVDVAARRVLEHGERELGLHVLLPDVDGHGVTVAAASRIGQGHVEQFPLSVRVPRPLLPLHRP